MATAADLIRRSLKLLGVYAAGESLRAEDAADGLVELNHLLGTWANERLQVHGTRRATYSLTPNISPHTIGPSGTITAPRPLRIDGAGIIRVAQTNETPLKKLSDGEYRAIGDKATTGDAPSSFWVEETAPDANLWFWPVPTSAATLVLYTWGRITEFALADTIALPDGYENALAHALAVQIAPMYGVEPSGVLMNNANEALAAIKRTNQRTPVLRADRAVPIGSFDLPTGGGGSDSGGLY